jgi:hypothetical protein
MTKQTLDGERPSAFDERSVDFIQQHRTNADIESDLSDHRKALEELSGPIPEDVWKLYRAQNEKTFSALQALDVAPLMQDNVSTKHIREMPSWTINETGLLLTGIDPRRLDRWYKVTPENQRELAFPEYFLEVMAVLESAASVGELHFPVVPRVLVKWWSRDTGRAIPAALKSWGQSRKKSNRDREDVAEIALRVYMPGQSLKELLQHPDLAPYVTKYQDPKTLRSWVKIAGIQLPKAGRPTKKSTA